MKYLLIEPEVAGGLGPHSIVHKSQGQLQVEKLHYVFEGWSGDEILESTPCYIVSKDLSGLIRAKGLSGIVFDSVEISCSAMFQELYPNRNIPPYVWMKITGVKSEDDFFQTEDACLVISDRAWTIIRPYASNAIVSDFVE